MDLSISAFLDSEERGIGLKEPGEGYREGPAETLVGHPLESAYQLEQYEPFKAKLSYDEIGLDYDPLPKKQLLCL